ncbi:MAG: hypothetical protein LAT64_06910 [Phycisphaerales bacterium]|nr:hypothetical protein [Planctomycetota bacterium]MCH8508484.1 hypothetical protein [Phycisphaerales bacterium]
MTRALIPLLTIPLLLLTACGPTPVRANRAWHGSTPINATYQFGRLTADLPPSTRVEPTTIAARQVLERQGHTIESAEATPQQGRIVALAPPSLGYKKITLRTSFEGHGTVLRLDVQPPNESRARVALESLLDTLGL